MKKKIGFEYRKGSANEEMPFAIFLNYSDEKEKSSGILGKILSKLLAREKMTLLDIGSGSGEYLRLALNAVFQKIAEQLPLRIEKFSVKVKLHLPYPDDMQDVISVVEFLLNTNWKDILVEIRDSILDDIRGRNGLLRQIDGFLVAEKIHHHKRH